MTQPTQLNQFTEHLNPGTLNAFIDGELPPAKQQEIEQHLTNCHAYTLRVLSATRLRAAIAGAGHRFEPRPDARARLTAQLRSQQTQTEDQPQTNTPARIYSIRPAAWAALAAAILLTISLLGWRQLHQTNTLAAELLDQHLVTVSSGATPQVISTDRHAVKPGSRTVSPSGSTFPTPRPYHPTPPSKAQISPTSTASPPPCSSSPSTNTRSPSSSRNELPAPPSPHCRAPTQASPCKRPPHPTCASSPSATSTQPTSISS